MGKGALVVVRGGWEEGRAACCVREAEGVVGEGVLVVSEVVQEAGAYLIKDRTGV